jgi:hypothetical protein
MLRPPRRVESMRRSARIRASTGRAEMPRAHVRKRPRMRKLVLE